MNTGTTVSGKCFLSEIPSLDNRLLILEDDKAVGELLQAIAETKGLMGIIVSNKEKFREAYLRLNPSVLILDIVLGDESVLPVVDYLGINCCKCPIFFLTGYNQDLLKRVSDKARASGLMIVGAYEKKGDGISRLMDKINSYILR